MHQPWRFLNNPFISATTHNYKKAFELAKFTDAALFSRIADPFFAALYATFHPLNLALKAEYEDWIAQGGSQEGSTLTVDQLLFQMAFGKEELGIASKINEWDFAVQSCGPTFRKGTANYKTIFPDGHFPFQRGDKDLRIAAVGALALAMAAYPATNAIKLAEVDPFLTLLEDARTAQEGEISKTGTDSGEVAEVVEVAMVGMFSVYGGLVQQFPANPELIAPIFDLELLRSLPQTEFVRTVPEGETESIAKRKLALTRKMKLTVLSAEGAEFFIAAEKNDPVRGKFVLVAGLEDQIVEASELMETLDSTFIKVRNTSSAVPAHVKIEILPEGA